MTTFAPGRGEQIRNAPNFRRVSAEAAQRDGHWLEFGVFQGSSARVLAALHTPLWGFDTFTGLPEPWRDHPAGYFDTGGTLPDVPGAEFVKGLFQDTLPGWLAQHPGPVALLHIDCDLYSSAEFVLRTLRLAGRLVAGTVVLFDEYSLGDDEQRAAAEQLEPYFTAEPLYTSGYRDSFRLLGLVESAHQRDQATYRNDAGGHGPAPAPDAG